jgi:hypothetical protein
VSTRRFAAIVAGTYLLLAALLIRYELSVRMLHTAQELTGLLSAGFTLPSIILVQVIAAAAFGVRMGDSDATFVTIPGLAALLNAFLLYLAIRGFQRPARRSS